MSLILVVEDEELIRVLAESILQDDGYDAVTAANAVEALALINGERRVDVLFTDINLGETNGLDLAQEIRALKPGIKVLYTSGAGVTDGTRSLFVEGAKFLAKPYRSDQLVAAMHGVLDG